MPTRHRAKLDFDRIHPFSEAAVILVSYVRFGKYPATHSYLTKFYGLCLLLAALTALLVFFNAGSWAIIALAIVALVTNLEIIAIHFLMNTPPVDVKSIFTLPRKNKFWLSEWDARH